MTIAATRAVEAALHRSHMARRAIEQAEWGADMPALKRELAEAEAELRRAYDQYDAVLLEWDLPCVQALRNRLPEGFTFMDGNPAPKGE
jgi:hypothetical protein